MISKKISFQFVRSIILVRARWTSTSSNSSLKKNSHGTGYPLTERNIDHCVLSRSCIRRPPTISAPSNSFSCREEKNDNISFQKNWHAVSTLAVNWFSSTFKNHFLQVSKTFQEPSQVYSESGYDYSLRFPTLSVLQPNRLSPKSLLRVFFQFQWLSNVFYDVFKYLNSGLPIFTVFRGFQITWASPCLIL